MAAPGPSLCLGGPSRQQPGQCRSPRARVGAMQMVAVCRLRRSYGPCGVVCLSWAVGPPKPPAQMILQDLGEGPATTLLRRRSRTQSTNKRWGWCSGRVRERAHRLPACRDHMGHGDSLQQPVVAAHVQRPAFTAGREHRHLLHRAPRTPRFPRESVRLACEHHGETRVVRARRSGERGTVPKCPAASRGSPVSSLVRGSV